MRYYISNLAIVLLFYSTNAFSTEDNYASLVGDFNNDLLAIGAQGGGIYGDQLKEKWIPLFERELNADYLNDSQRKYLVDVLVSMYLPEGQHDKCVELYSGRLNHSADAASIADAYVKLVSIEEIRFQSGDISLRQLLDTYKQGYQVLLDYNGSPLSSMSFLVDYSIALSNYSKYANLRGLYDLGSKFYAQHSTNVNGYQARSYYESFRTLFYMCMSNQFEEVDDYLKLSDDFLARIDRSQFGVDTVKFLASCASEWTQKSYHYYSLIERHQDLLIELKGGGDLLMLADFYSRRGRVKEAKAIQNIVFRWIDSDKLNAEDLGITPEKIEILKEEVNNEK